jgi:2-dehydro-3-deoxygluconokinase
MELRDKSTCSYDAVSLGEVMLRLDPGDLRIRTTRQFKAWEGGGEYNVARGLRKCFGLKTAIVSALVDNEVGRLLEDLILQGGVDTSLLQWKEFDGIGRTARNGLNFTERGFGVRGALGVSDRGMTAVSQLKAGDINWNHLFGDLGVRWFHTGGIFAALSETTPDVVEEAMVSAKKHGTIISYDLNYRSSLWKGIGGKEKAQTTNQRIAKFVDVMLGNEEDFTEALGFTVPGLDSNYHNLDNSAFAQMVQEVTKAYPNLSTIATTLRSVHSASNNDWAAIAWSAETGLLTSIARKNLEILDRVGGGDSFASGLIYGLLEGKSLQDSLELGAAHGALAMTTPGDTSMATKAEVKRLAEGGNARVRR